METTLMGSGFRAGNEGMEEKTEESYHYKEPFPVS